MFDTIAFAIICRGCNARCALEAEDTGATRIDRIYRLIEECRFGISRKTRCKISSRCNEARATAGQAMPPLIDIVCPVM